jgi:hypothetical protein
MKAIPARKVSVIAILLAAGLGSANGQTNTFPSSGNVGIGTMSPQRTLDVLGQARATYLWAGQSGGSNDGRLYVTDSAGNIKVIIDGASGASSYINSGNLGIGTASPVTLLQVAGAITAGASGGSTSGIDYLYGNYGNGKIFVLGSQYSSAASFLAYAVKAQPGATGYLSSTGVPVGRSTIEAGNGYVALLTGSVQTSTDGGAVSISERLRVDSSGNVGIGTASPAVALDISGGSSYVNSNPTYQLFGSGDKIVQVRGTNQSVISLLSDVNTDGGKIGGMYFGRTIGQGDAWINLIGIRGVQRGGTGAVVQGDLTVQSHTNGELLRVMGDTGNVGIGTTNPTQKLSVNGTIRAKEVIVEASPWPDDVFDESYKLKALSEIEAFVKAEKHLPGIPSEQQVAEQGVALGNMQAALLRKMEEMTLHLIAQEKRIVRLERENAELRATHQ